MAHIEVKAQQLVAEAEKKMTASGFFQAIFGRSNRLEQAIDYYQRAGNLFKMAKNWSEAHEAFKNAAEINEQNGDKYEAATLYIDAANCAKKCDTSKAVNYILKAIEVYADLGKFNLAAKYHQMIGEILENDEVCLEKAMQHYEQAADYYLSEELHSAANKCLAKVAEYAATNENYSKAIEIFQQIACTDLASSLLKYSAKEYFFRAGICQLCADVLNVRTTLNSFVQIYPAFQDTREYKLLAYIVECIEESDVDGFTNSVKKYDSISRLSPWHVSMFLRIKGRITDAPDLR